MTEINFTGFLREIVLLLSFSTAMVVIFLSRYKREMILKKAIILFLTVVVYFISHESLYLVLFLSALILKDEEDMFCGLRALFYARLWILLGVVFCSVLRIIPFRVIEVNKSFQVSQRGYCFGYIHPNSFAASVFFLISLYFCIHQKRKQNYDLIIVVFIDLFLYGATKSKTSCALIMVLLLGMKMIRDDPTVINSALKTCGRFMVFFGCGIGIGIPMIYAQLTGRMQFVAYKLNGLLNNRLLNATFLIKTHDLSLFGQIIDTKSMFNYSGYGVIDNGYIFALYNFGIVGFLLLIFFYYVSLKVAIRDDKLVYSLTIVLYLFMAISENCMRSMYMSYVNVLFFLAINEPITFKLITKRSKESKIDS